MSQTATTHSSASAEAIRAKRMSLLAAIASAFAIIFVPTAFWLGILELGAYLLGTETTVAVRSAVALVIIPILTLIWGFTNTSSQQQSID